MCNDKHDNKRESFTFSAFLAGIGMDKIRHPGRKSESAQQRGRTLNRKVVNQFIVVNG